MKFWPSPISHGHTHAASKIQTHTKFFGSSAGAPIKSIITKSADFLAQPGYPRRPNSVRRWIVVAWDISRRIEGRSGEPSRSGSRGPLLAAISPRGDEAPRYCSSHLLAAPSIGPLRLVRSQALDLRSTEFA